MLPDVAQVEYYAIPQYALQRATCWNITDKTSGYSDFYTPGPWASVQFAGKVYGLPDGFRPNGLLLQQGGLRQGRC